MEREAVCEQLQAVFMELRSLSVKIWMLLEPLVGVWAHGHFGTSLYVWGASGGDLKEVVL